MSALDGVGTRRLVYIVDDDEAIRKGLTSLFMSVGYQVETFESVATFLEFEREDASSCLILDVRLRGENGLAFQRECHRLRLHIPIIFISGHGDVEMSVQAMKAGAVTFLEKPFCSQTLLDAVKDALALDSARRSSEQSSMALRASYATLTQRERDVMRLVITGLLNKQIAAELGVSVDSIKQHRSQMMRKMNSRSVPELVRKATHLAGLGKPFRGVDENAF
ncbi:LuxR family two component transcriptional regulator [Paraburkholderia rhizosphaerae]|uniref:LuxR family two component transcriptional regulator n=1 Tax=Paraburkholderia rhizosphaerae TaxID=480658 RepID=A0A4R8L3D0_9BURK|nr:LuxR family two component transcriptional regulator [Paraburkholderia rhizosphaerae]